MTPVIKASVGLALVVAAWAAIVIGADLHPNVVAGHGASIFVAIIVNVIAVCWAPGRSAAISAYPKQLANAVAIGLVGGVGVFVLAWLLLEAVFPNAVAAQRDRDPTSSRPITAANSLPMLGTVMQLGTGIKRRSRSSQDFIQTIERAGDFLVGGPRKAWPDAIDRQRADLADLDPRPLRQAIGSALERQRESGPRFLTRHRPRNDGARPFVEDVVAQHQNRSPARLLVASNGVQISPADFAPQYSGHDSNASARPSSASRFSSRGFSFADSLASRVRARRCSLSASAVSTAWLRFRKRFRSTRSSTCSSRRLSSVSATLVFGIGMTYHHTRSCAA
jgi:hypothetical protein